MQAPTIVVTVLLAVLFLYTGLPKVLGAARSLAFRDHLGVPPSQWRLIGLLELAAVAGLLLGFALPALGLAAAAGLLILTAGAIATHRRAGDPLRAAAPAAVAAALAAISLALQIGDL